MLKIIEKCFRTKYTTNGRFRRLNEWRWLLRATVRNHFNAICVSNHFRSHIYISLILCVYLVFICVSFILLLLMNASEETNVGIYSVDVMPVPITNNVIYVSQSTYFTCNIQLANTWICCQLPNDGVRDVSARRWLYDQPYGDCTLKLMRAQQHAFELFKKQPANENSHQKNPERNI